MKWNEHRISPYKVMTVYHYGLTITCAPDYRPEKMLTESMHRIGGLPGICNFRAFKEYTKKGQPHYHCEFVTFDKRISDLKFIGHGGIETSFTNAARYQNDGEYVKLETLNTQKSVIKWANYIRKDQKERSEFFNLKENTGMTPQASYPSPTAVSRTLAPERSGGDPKGASVLETPPIPTDSEIEAIECNDCELF